LSKPWTDSILSCPFLRAGPRLTVLSITAPEPFLFTRPSIPEAEKSWARLLNAIPVASSSTFLPTSWPPSPSDARSTSLPIISRPTKPSSLTTFWPIIPKSAFILHPPILLGLTKSKSGSPKSKGRSLPEASSPPSTISAEKSSVISGTTTRRLLPSNGLTLRLPNESSRSSFICYTVLGLLGDLALRIREDEKALEAMVEASPSLNHVRSIPGMGPILAAVVVSEIDTINRFPSAQKLCGYAGLCPSTSSSGGKTFQGKLLSRCNKWLCWAFVEAAWVAIGCSAYFGDFYKCKRALGKKPNIAILATARLMARITWQLLTQCRNYTRVPEPQYPRSQPAERIACAVSLAKEVQKSLKDPSDFPRRRLSPVAPK